MEHPTPAQFVTLSNPGVTSRQLLSPYNSASQRITITRVSVAPGATHSRHAHATAEQVGYSLAGSGTLLLAEGRTQAFATGEAVRFADTGVHGFHNSGDVPFESLSVTSPPIDFAPAYARREG